MQSEASNDLGRYTISFHGRSQGTVIGDGNAVFQSYYPPPVETPKPVAPAPPIGFMGRDELVEQLTQQIVSSPRPVNLALWGVPGVGKSALTRAIADRLDGHFPDGCLWGDVRQAQGNRRAILDSFALSLGQEPRSFPNPQPLMDRIRALLRSRSMLIVLDNVSRLSEVEPFLDIVGSSKSALIITTRSRELAVDSAALAIEAMPLTPQFAEDMLRSFGQLSDSIELTDLVAGTAGIPLLIEACGRRIKKARPEQREEIIHRLEQELHSPAHQLALAVGDISYRDVLMLNFEAAPAESQRILHLMGLLSPQPVSEGSLRAIMELKTDALDQAMDALVDLALVEQAEQGTWRLPGTIYALASEVALQSADKNGLYQEAIAHFRQQVERSWVSEADGLVQAQLAHFMALFDLAVTSQDWNSLFFLTDLANRTMSVSGELRVVYETSWPLAKLDVRLRGSYLDQVDWSGMVTGDLDIRDSWLRKTRLAGSQMGDMHIRQSTLSEVDMRGIRAGDLHFRECNIGGLDLRGAQLGDLHFHSCRITHLLLDDTAMGLIHLGGCIVAETDLSQLGQIVLEDYLPINVKLPDNVEPKEPKETDEL